jgi:hypothetical protein
MSIFDEAWRGEERRVMLLLLMLLTSESTCEVPDDRTWHVSAFLCCVEYAPDLVMV